VAWPPYEASDLRDVERRVLECLGAALVSEWIDLPTDVQRRLFEHAASGKRRRVEDADRCTIIKALRVGAKFLRSPRMRRLRLDLIR
jgi:hypothetical protein